MHYAIGDVHGYYEDLMNLINTIEKQDPEARFVLLGDLIDRGPDTLKVLDWAMTHIQPDGKYQCIRGNHEDLALQWYRYRFLPWERKNRGRDFSSKEPIPRSKFNFAEIVEQAGIAQSMYLLPIMKFLDSLPYRLEIDTFVNCQDADIRGLSDLPIQGKIRYKLVHGWYQENAAETIQKHLNLRGRVFSGNPGAGYVIIHGHTPTTNPDYIKADPLHTHPGKISYRLNAIDIDGGRAEETWQGKPCMLCGICLETLQDYYCHMC